MATQLPQQPIPARTKTITVVLSWWAFTVMAGWFCMLSMVCKEAICRPHPGWFILVNPLILGLIGLVATLISVVTVVPAVLLLRSSSLRAIMASLVPTSVIPSLLLGHLGIHYAIAGYLWSAGVVMCVLYARGNLNAHQSLEGIVLCRRCGYDVRATRRKCPECGLLNPSETSGPQRLHYPDKQVLTVANDEDGVIDLDRVFGGLKAEGAKPGQVRFDGGRSGSSLDN